VHPDSLCASSCRWKAHQYGSFQTVMAYASASSIRYVIILILLSHYPYINFPFSFPFLVLVSILTYSISLLSYLLLFVCLLACLFFVLFFYNFLGSSDGPFPAYRKKQYLELYYAKSGQLVCCTRPFFFFITSSRMFEGRGEE
jgi:hypothetical protein